MPGPINRKKNVTGKASEESVKTEGSGLGQGPVGKNDGYDADKDSYCDLVEAGVIDPAKVVRTAIQNAASVAALLLTTSCLLTEIPKDEPATPDPNAMGGMGGGMGGF